MRHVASLLTAIIISATLYADDYRFPIDKIDETLRYIGIDTSDIFFRTDYVDRDSFRLPIIDDLTQHPLDIPDFLKSHADLLLDTTATLSSVFQHLGGFLTVSAPGVVPAPYEVSHIRSPQAPETIAREFVEQLEALLQEMEEADQALREMIGTMPEEEIAFLTDTFVVFLLEEEQDVNRSAEELDSLQKLHEQLALRFKEMQSFGILGQLASTQQRVIERFCALHDWLDTNQSILRTHQQAIDGYFEPGYRTPVGRVAVGLSGDDVYEGSYALIIDLGGNDEYRLTGAPFQYQIIIDLSGDDKYYAQSDYVFGTGFFSTGILDDWEGDDIYIADNFSLGCGLFGVGILIDRMGKDIYRGDICTEGTASFGVGLLIDRSGHDSYTSRIFSQGFGFIMGIGALVDNRGNDSYTAGWKYGDVLRYREHYLSLSQGFGYGLRPHFSGGIGLLIDGAGNDLYNADIFAQGASYWYALGGLVDYSGSDRYIAHQYAQGSATHLCLASLIDINGDDLYSSKGVSQGCGHDLAFGLLLDCQGNDQYNAFDLSQAAGSANGVGMLIDLAGDDGHIARVKKNTHGYGNPRRDYGSIGLFLDLDGKDDYRGYGSDNSYWVTDSKWGIGADISREPQDDK